MANITTTAVLPPAVRDYYSRLLLMTAFPMLVHTKFGQKRMLPKKSGNTVVMRRYSKLDPVPVPLDDGITPPGAPLSVTDIKATVKWYGNFVTLTDQVQLTVEDQVLNEASRLLAQNMAETIDQITRDVLISCATVIAAANGNNGNTPTNLTKADIDSVWQTLLNNDAKMISEVIPATDRFATSPIRAAFMGFIDTSLLDDLEKVSDFVPVAQYSSAMKAQDGEWGATSNVRWFYTSVGYVSGSSPAVYSLPIVGQEAYGLVHLGSDSGEFYVNPLGSAGAADPLQQRGSAGWKHPFVARILNDSYMAILLATHS